MKWLTILNPASSGRRTEKRIDYIKDNLSKISEKMIVTTHQGHAKEIAQEAKDYDGIAVAGGDGTIFEVINGMDIKRQVIGILPVGTANCLAREFKMNNLKDGIKAIKGSHTEKIDILHLKFTDSDDNQTQAYATITLGLGYPTNVAEFANQKLKFMGNFCYPVAALIIAFKNVSKSYSIMLNGNQPEKKTLNGLIINNSRFAGNFTLFPDAKIKDGRFEVMETNANFFSQTLHNLSVFSGTYFYNPANQFSSNLMEIITDEPHNLMVDGEIFENITKLSIEMLPRSLTCHTNGV
ncbi:MAG: hypothetical protein HN729_07710 [Candidatus Marinimicrobia bacterium]|jgi:YegS/Rv2252/BmrU family lipid kinase|nr:hypothetical protein [Candidatus Neomarinimicrobiota bacterium]MBT3633024.1 hypothetical protein [Candidatus Neomarinimicrobiota bacterium]MBT3683534.1 hypothetical protein [Candidatus Neomarinimicrobiota bacterium]MBT3758624.1 hypothetical protein [Candidatus Neomarinimicrobiota bacterium]MBT3896467.1 hypothetical protein [Candidatus Neomarinimicrobiota bacterium]